MKTSRSLQAAAGLKPALVAAALAASVASPALAQSSANERNFLYVGKSDTTVVMVSGVPTTPSTGQVTFWTWHLFGPDHQRSNAVGPFGRAVRVTVDCSDRTSINRAAEMFNGLTFESRIELDLTGRWATHGSDTLGALPIKAACDPSPATPRPFYPDFAAARANADLRLKPAPTN